MTDYPRLLTALTVLVALPALAAPAHAIPSASAVAAPRHSTSILDVANQRHPHQNVDRRVDRGGDTGDAEVERLNQMSLQRAQQGQNAPGPGPDTTSTLNRMSDQDATQGRNTGSQPLMPFR